MSRVVLNGISTILSKKKALLTVIPQTTKPGQPAKPESFILAENQREGEIEVLKIDERAGIVKIDNSGKPMTITFEETKKSQPSTTYQPPSGTGMVPNTVRTLPSRFPRSALSAAPAPLPAGAQTSPGTVPSATGYSATGYPPNGYPANGYVTPNNTASGGQQLTPEEQTFLSDVQNAVNNQNQPQPPKPPPGRTSLPPPPDNYLPKKIPLMPQ
jgi:hypothetical protein